MCGRHLTYSIEIGLFDKTMRPRFVRLRENKIEAIDVPAMYKHVPLVFSASPKGY